MQSWLRVFIFIATLFCVQAHAAPSKIIRLNINGAIGPAVADYTKRGIKLAEEQNADLVILTMDTPGGLDKSMRVMIKAILASPVPVVSYVAPSGARAASAGTYLLYASHVAAMAPGTNLGAATPVSIGGTPQPDKDKPMDKKDDKKKPKAESPKSAPEQKAINDAKAYIRSLAQLRKRNVEWAEQAVLKAESLSAEDALKRNVIDLIAVDTTELIKKIQGRTVEVRSVKKVIDIKNPQFVEFKPDWRLRLLAVITDPSVAYILLLLGMYGLFFEFANPGFVLPGVVGAISMLLALYALQLLPISYAGLALMLLGIAFMVGEAFMPSFGALGIGGVIAFVAGSVMLLENGAYGFSISLPLIIFMAVVNAAFFICVIGMVWRARRKKVVSGQEQLIDSIAVVIDDFEGKGQVKLGGEIWQAKTSVAVTRGQRVRVLEVKGLLLVVEPTE